MTDFNTIDYLKKGNPKQQRVHNLLTSTGIMSVLHAFSPILTGTIPIAIDTDSSDLDIICFWRDKNLFTTTLLELSYHESFELTDKTVNGRDTIIARFIVQGFAAEIFGQNRLVEQQEAYRHMIAEDKILKVKGEVFRKEIIALKEKGIKTELAFGILMGMDNPYEQLLHWND